MFFDTHIHLTDFSKPISDTLQELDNADVSKCVCVSAKEEDWDKIAQVYSIKPSTIIPSFGLHPWYITHDLSWREKLHFYIRRFPNAAIGECGFDKKSPADFERQKETFEYQLELAHQYHRPLILHIVKSENYVMPYFGKLPSRTVFHSFSGSVQMLNKILNFNHYLSVNKRFFKKKYACEILNFIPIDRLLLETDAPFQSEVFDLNDVVCQIAQIKQLNEDELKQKLYANAMEVFCCD